MSGKRAGGTTDAVSDPKRRVPLYSMNGLRSSPPSPYNLSPPPSPSPYNLSPSSPSLYRSPSPYGSLSPSPYRSPSPSPCRSWSQREPSYDDERRSRSRGSEDGHELSVWRPHSVGEGNGDGKLNVQISDYDLLFTCRSCHRMLTSPVFQCATGHVTCYKCHNEVGDNRCSFCGSSHGYRRDVAVENFIHRTSFSCHNQAYGCTTFLPHNMMHTHQQSCIHEPCFCPVPLCGFATTARGTLVDHLTNHHHWVLLEFRYGESFHAPVNVPSILRSTNDSEIFHLNRNQESCGVALSMICLRPDNAPRQEFTYNLKLPAGRHMLQMESTVWNTSLRCGMGDAGRVFMMVPVGLEFGSNIVNLCITKASDH